jgi:hypothetical protein
MLNEEQIEPQIHDGNVTKALRGIISKIKKEIREIDKRNERHMRDP